MKNELSDNNDDKVNNRKKSKRLTKAQRKEQREARIRNIVKLTKNYRRQKIDELYDAFKKSILWEKIKQIKFTPIERFVWIYEYLAPRKAEAGYANDEQMDVLFANELTTLRSNRTRDIDIITNMYISKVDDDDANTISQDILEEKKIDIYEIYRMKLSRYNKVLADYRREANTIWMKKTPREKLVGGMALEPSGLRKKRYYFVSDSRTSLDREATVREKVDTMLYNAREEVRLSYEVEETLKERAQAQKELKEEVNHLEQEQNQKGQETKEEEAR